jgi:hypothetical protein
VGNLCDAGVNDSGRPSCAKVVCDPGAMIKMCSSRKGGMLIWAGPNLSTAAVIGLKWEPRLTELVVAGEVLSL